jgi:steroid delta-isomerase-like uncharacterized protein
MKTTDENKAMIKRFYEEVMNSHDVTTINSFCAADFTDHNPNPGYSGKGLDDLVAQLNEMFVAFPDLHAKSDFMVAEEDMVVVHLTLTGTNSGPFLNMPATNKPFKINGIDIILMKDGKAIERWGVFEDLSLMTQLGMMGSENPLESSRMVGH